MIFVTHNASTVKDQKYYMKHCHCMYNMNPGRFGPIPVQSGRFGPISVVSRFGPVWAGRFGPIS